jgi:hypothetical protein
MKVGIICRLDGLANSVRANELKRFIEKRGHEVILLNVHGRVFNAKWHFRKCKARNLLKGMGWSYNYHVESIRHQALVLEREIRPLRLGALICEDFRSAYVLTKNLGCITIYDEPTPTIPEIRETPEYGISRHEIEQLEEIEREVFQAANFVSFHWHAYARYLDEIGVSPSNLITLDWGCHPAEQRAAFARPARIAFIGNLSGSWVDPEMLARLATRSNGRLDVYGLPAPSNPRELNYKGYTDPQVLRHYQFGLVTISTAHPLHCKGFSAKHMEYISYGLPVFEPEWREISGLEETCIFYNEENFAEKIEEYSDPKEWQQMSDIAYECAKAYDWDKTLQPLADIIG